MASALKANQTIRHQKFLRLKALRQQRQRKLAGHVCVPEYRGVGHVYAYCKSCGRGMTQLPQRAHDLAQQIKQIATAKMEVASDHS